MYNIALGRKVKIDQPHQDFVRILGRGLEVCLERSETISRVPFNLSNAVIGLARDGEISLSRDHFTE